MKFLSGSGSMCCLTCCVCRGCTDVILLLQHQGLRGVCLMPTSSISSSLWRTKQRLPRATWTPCLKQRENFSPVNVKVLHPNWFQYYFVAECKEDVMCRLWWELIMGRKWNISTPIKLMVTNIELGMWHYRAKSLYCMNHAWCTILRNYFSLRRF